ncbi:MAG: hypothetical protein DWQ42_12965 [Planctomycetota bacterium]|nr:MAG: hypothetical protein DWQ42_12965 [Planctomycetota bacterium]REK42514.1 MAG: hypothetical protein DWQ46_12915 [Planctomycetota bacterium]
MPPQPTPQARVGQQVRGSQHAVPPPEAVAVPSMTPLAPANTPNRDQRRLLRAALGPDAQAGDAWRAWRARYPRPLVECEPAARSLFPLIYTNLSRAGYDGPDLAELRELYERTWIANQVRARGLVELLRAFRQAGIVAMPMKGMALALFYYDDLAVRPMGDVDLLIRPGDLEAASQILTASGWQADQELPPEHLRPYLVATGWDHARFGPLDLHWNPYTVDVTDETCRGLWQRAVVRSALGVEILVPDTTDLLVHMGFHSRKADPQSAARWVADLLQLVADKKAPVRWSELVSRATEFGMVGPVRDALIYLREQFAADVPDDVLCDLIARPLSDVDHRRYEGLARDSSPASVGAMISLHWQHYTAGCRGAGRWPTPWGFARYALSYGRHRYGCHTVAEVADGVLRRHAAEGPSLTVGNSATIRS